MFAPQGQFLAAVREILDAYGIEQAQDYIEKKAADLQKMGPLTANPMFIEVWPFPCHPRGSRSDPICANTLLLFADRC
jgi:hypothetical protein